MKARTAALALLCLVAPARAWAQPSAPGPVTPEAQKEGRDHFARGIALYKERNFGGARVEFQRAYDVAPSYRILFNLGQSAYELQDYAGAWSAFTRFLVEGADHVPAARRAEVEQSLRDLEQRVARVEVSTSVPGADVSIDGEHVGTTPLAAPVVVSVGRRSVTATLPGRIPASKTVDVAGGDRTALTLDLEAPVVTAPFPVVPAAPPPPPVLADSPPPPVAVPPPSRSASTTPVWVGAGATAALAVTSAVFGALTLHANSSYNADLGQFPGSASAIASARTEVHTYALVADIAGGAALAGLGVTCYFGLVRRDSAPRASVAFLPTSARFQLAF